MPELTSIITPCFNAAAYLDACIQSVRAQTHCDWEMIIVDDCSTDSSLEIAQQYANLDNRIRIIRLDENQGVVAARNAALHAAQGRFIAFLDSDDRWLPRKLELQLQLMTESGAAISFGSYYVIDQIGQRIKYFAAPDRTNYAHLLKGNCIGNLTGIYDASRIGKEFFERMGHEDYVMWLAIIKRVPFAIGVKECIAEYRVSKGSLSANKSVAARWTWEIYRNVEKLPLHLCIFYFACYAYKGFSKYRKIASSE